MPELSGLPATAPLRGIEVISIDDGTATATSPIAKPSAIRERTIRDMSTILVTGGSGFIGSHAILQLLDKGHHVRTTVRSLQREDSVRAMLRQGGTEAGDRLSFVAADLDHDAGWPEA